MNYATHILDPQQNPNSSFVRMMCGRLKHKRTDVIKTSENTDEVTCTKCLGFVSNPARILRKYGHVMLIQPYGISVSKSWGYQIQIIAFTTDTACENWRYIAEINQETELGSFEALTFKDAIESIINIVETKITTDHPERSWICHDHTTTL